KKKSGQDPPIAKIIKLHAQIPSLDKMDSVTLGQLTECEFRNILLKKASLNSSTKNLKILSLSRNNIKKLEKFEDVAETLEEKIEGLENLTKLRVLYLSNNKIQFFEELDRIVNSIFFFFCFGCFKHVNCVKQKAHLTNLKDILLLGNPIYLTAPNTQAYRYQVEVIKRLPNFTNWKLDGVMVTKEKLKKQRRSKDNFFFCNCLKSLLQRLKKIQKITVFIALMEYSCRKKLSQNVIRMVTFSSNFQHTIQGVSYGKSSRFYQIKEMICNPSRDSNDPTKVLLDDEEEILTQCLNCSVEFGDIASKGQKTKNKKQKIKKQKPRRLVFLEDTNDKHSTNSFSIPHHDIIVHGLSKEDPNNNYLFVQIENQDSRDLIIKTDQSDCCYMRKKTKCFFFFFFSFFLSLSKKLLLTNV
ncbi:flagellar outer dynein arm light chain LC1, partial [Reticulomyxa filosa]